MMESNNNDAMEYRKIEIDVHTKSGDDNLALEKSPSDESTAINICDNDNEDISIEDIGYSIKDEVDLFSPFTEYVKFILSCTYCAVIMIAQAFSMVYVTDRIFVFRNETQLPDLILDSIAPYWWGLRASEYCLVALFGIWLLICIFHKHRIVLLRRQYYVQGSMYLMRIITTTVTGLPLIDDHKRFAREEHLSSTAYFKRAFQMVSSMSMSITAESDIALSYGDYIFSGHIMLSTMLTALICKYSPRSCWWLHTGVILLNIAASIFMMLAHGHYTIDVILSLILTPFYFCLYHLLVDFKAISRKKPSIFYIIIFPFYTCFESNNVLYKNDYESPGTLLKRAKKLKSVLGSIKLC